MTAQENSIIDQAIAILDSRLKTFELIITKPEDVKNFLRLKLEECEREIFAVLYLDTQNKLIKYSELFYGTYNEAKVWPREIAREVLATNCSSVVLVHNHPSGTQEASKADIAITKRIKECLELVDAKVLDHMIVCKGKVLSFAEEGLI
jgi:DNA repair protein RadC